jgi:hypothetical protein
MYAVIKIFRNDEPYYLLTLYGWEVESASFAPAPGVTYEEITGRHKWRAIGGDWVWEVKGEIKRYPMDVCGGKPLAYLYINNKKMQLPFSILPFTPEDTTSFRIEVNNGVKGWLREEEIWS